MFQRLQRLDQAIEPRAGEEHENGDRERDQAGRRDRRHLPSIPAARLTPMTPADFIFPPRGKQAQTQALRKVSRGELPLDAVACVVEPRSEGAESALAGRNRDDAAADPALARQPDVVKPVARSFVEARRRHHRQRALAAFGVDHSRPGQRVDPAVGERRAHDGKVPRGHVERTLPRIEVDGVGRVDGDLSVTVKQLADRLIARIAIGGRGEHGAVDLERPAGES